MKTQLNLSTAKPLNFVGPQGQNRLDRKIAALYSKISKPNRSSPLRNRIVRFQELKISNGVTRLFPRLISLEIDLCKMKGRTFSNLVFNNRNSLKTISLDGTYPTKALRYCTKINDITICNSDITDAELNRILKNKPNLQALDIHNCIELDYSFYTIAELNGLTLLNLSATYINDDQLDKILQKHGRTLTYLDLSTCPELTSKTLDLIENSCTQLKTLYLHFNYDIIDEGEPILQSNNLLRHVLLKQANQNLKTVSYGYINDSVPENTGVFTFT